MNRNVPRQSGLDKNIAARLNFSRLLERELAQVYSSLLVVISA